ncbi:MAG TPA: hypothetical protein VFT87_01930 [Candidatus Saccharimonadales bacterium]|nr:hypothetical protein [Candidatus Saccharimonadales bacterium]
MRRFRPLIIALAAIIALIVGALMLFNRATTTEIKITTNEASARITVGTPERPEQIVRVGSTTVTLGAGDYTVKVQKDDQETRTLITVVQGQPQTVDLPLTPVKGGDFVGAFAGSNLNASKDGLTFIWSDYGQLLRLPAGGGTATPLIDAEVSEAFWINETQGYIRDSSDVYNFFDGQRLRPLPYNVSPNTFSATASGAIAYGDQTKVFVRPSSEAAPVFEFEYPAGQLQTRIGAQDYVLVFDIDVGPETSAEQQKPAIFKAGKKVDSASERIQNLLINGATWSPDGNVLALNAGEGLFLLDLRTNTLARLSQEASVVPEGVVWQGSDTLFYIQDARLWRVSLSNRPMWTKLANINDSVGLLGPLAVSPDNKVYFSTNNARLQGTIFRVNVE